MVAGKIRLRANLAHYVKYTSARLPIILGVISFQEHDCLRNLPHFNCHLLSKLPFT